MMMFDSYNSIQQTMGLNPAFSYEYTELQPAQVRYQLSVLVILPYDVEEPPQ